MYVVENHKGREIYRGTNLEGAKRFAFRYAHKLRTTATVKTDEGKFITAYEVSVVG